MISQSGQGTLDFLFAMVLIFATAALIGALSIALTLTEAIQYVSFSGARAYFAADKTPAQQAAVAEAQVDALLKNLPFISGARSSGWMNITRRAAKNYTDYAANKGGPVSSDRNEFIGYQLEVSLPILTFRIPLMGNLVTPPNEEDVKVTVSSFLMREPSFSECERFNNQLYQAVLQKNQAGGYSRALSSRGVKITPDSFRAINDNGC